MFHDTVVSMSLRKTFSFYTRNISCLKCLGTILIVKSREISTTGVNYLAISSPLSPEAFVTVLPTRKNNFVIMAKVDSRFY
jgi:hypothetical protein